MISSKVKHQNTLRQSSFRQSTLRLSALRQSASAILLLLGLSTGAQATGEAKQPTTANTVTPNGSGESSDMDDDTVGHDSNPTVEQEYSGDYPWLDEFHASFSTALDDSALWLNERFADDEVQFGGSKAWARMIMGWEPKTGDLSDFPLKFKVKVKLPNLKHNINLVFSDNEAEDFNRLPLETSRPASDSLDSKDFSAAIQLLHKVSEHSYFRSRLGISSAQIYTRSSYRWKEKFFDNLTLTVEPSLEYYIEDGAGYRFLTELSYFPSDSSEVRASYSIWDREELPEPRWKKAIYHLNKLDDSSTLITGVLVNGVTSPNYRDEKVTVSTRYRRHALRKWLFFEVEPFVDFERHEDYKSRWGVALRVGGYFGYH